MGNYEAQIRSIHEGGSPAEPFRMLVTHRSGQAELQIGRLSGGHLLHMAVAGCVYGALFTIARNRGVTLRDCKVTVDGGFEDDPPRSSGIAYDIELAADAPADELEAIAREADVESAIPNLMRATTNVVLRKVEVRTLDQRAT